MKNTYIMNKETGKIELHMEKEDYDSLSEAEQKSLRGAYLWSGKLKAWVSRAKFPNLYHPKQIAKELGFTEEEKVGERLTYAQQLERQTERAEARAERYEGYASNAEKRGKALTSELEQHRGDIAFLTQPIIHGHKGSESFANRRRQIYSRFDKGMEEYRKSEYFKGKAATAMATAENAKLKVPSYLYNRIKEGTAAIRKLNKNLDKADALMTEIENSPEENPVVRGYYMLEKVTEWRERLLEMMEVEIDKLGFFQNALEEIGGFRFNQGNIKPGYVIKMRRLGNYKVLKTDPTTLYAKSISTGGMCSFNYAEIEEIISAEETSQKESQLHPHKKHDILVWNPRGPSQCLAAYQVIDVTEKTVLMREIKLDSDGKPVKDAFLEGQKAIRRKPYVNFITNSWGICGANERILRQYIENKGDDDGTENV